jgi:hypothetical protein
MSISNYSRAQQVIRGDDALIIQGEQLHRIPAGDIFPRMTLAARPDPRVYGRGFAMVDEQLQYCTGVAWLTMEEFADPNLITVTATGGTSAITLANRFGFDLWLEDLAAQVTGSGATEDWAPAIQYFHDHLAVPGTAFRLRAKSRVYRLATPINITHGFDLIGQSSEEGPSPGQGTWFDIATTDAAQFTLTTIDSRGFAMRDFGLTQAHPGSAPGWGPTVYPWVFDVQETLGTVVLENVFCAPIYRLMNAYNAGRIQFRGKVWGQVFHRLLEVDFARDVTYFDASIHLWPFWSSDANVLAWQRANGDPFYFKRCDSIHANTIFTYGYHSGIRIGGSASGTTTKLEISTLSTDSTCRGIWIESSANTGPGVQYPPTIHIDRALFNADGITPLDPTIGDSYGLFVEANNCRLYFGYLQVDASAEEALKIIGRSNYIHATELEFFRCIRKGDSSTAFADLGTDATGPNKLAYDKLSITGGTYSNPFIKSGNTGNATTNVLSDRGVGKDSEVRAGWGASGTSSATLNISSPGANCDLSISAKGSGIIYAEKSLRLQEGGTVSARTGQTTATLGVAPVDGGGTGTLAQSTAGNTSLTNNYSGGNLDLSQTGAGKIRCHIGGVVGFQVGAALPGSYADDAAAAAGGVPLYGYYHTSGAVKQRLA